MDQRHNHREGLYCLSSLVFYALLVCESLHAGIRFIELLHKSS